MLQTRGSDKPAKLAILFLLAILLGCDTGMRPGDKPPDFTAYGTLPGLAKSPDTVLQDELARLQAEEVTPAQLQAANPILPNDDNIAAGLREQLSAEKVMRAMNDIAEIYPHDQFIWPAGSLERARELIKYHRIALAQMQAVLDRPECSFQIDFANGILAEIAVFDTATLAHRWEALDAAIHMADGDLDKAEQNLVRMLRLDQAMAHESHLVPRLKAVTMRLEALRVLEALVQHPAATPQLAARLRDLLALQLAAWPADSQAWIGDRAIGLHTYEMIRHGYVLSVLTEDELAALRKEPGVSATAKAIQKHIEADERYYATTMREIITACEQPYYQRHNLLVKVEQYLKETELSPEFPMVAGKILLTHLDTSHRRQAHDLAAMEGWHLLLCAATDEPLPAYEVNPSNGKPYKLQAEVQRVLLYNSWLEEVDEPLMVPKF